MADSAKKTDNICETCYRCDQRVKILKAALTLYVKKGYAETSTLEIAHQAGLSERTLLKYFQTKQDLLDGVLRFYTQKLLAKDRRSYITGESSQDRLACLFKHKIEIIESDPDFIRFILRNCLSDQKFKSALLTYWTKTFDSKVFGSLTISDRMKEKYGDRLQESLSTAVLSQLLGFTMIKLLFDDAPQLTASSQADFCAEILFNGINSLTDNA